MIEESGEKIGRSTRKPFFGAREMLDRPRDCVFSHEQVVVH
jgi:hypothetical protein